MSSSKPILFYSKNDQRSKNLWSKLSKENRLNNFLKICVDNNPKIPSIITTVPSIFIKGRPVIYGPAIQMYLDNAQPTQNGQQPGGVRQEQQFRQRSGDFQNRLEELQKARGSF